MVGSRRTAATGCANGATGSTASEPGIRGDRNCLVQTLAIAPVLHTETCAEFFARGQIVAYIRAGRILIHPILLDRPVIMDILKRRSRRARNLV
jgi:hypothetical protein